MITWQDIQAKLKEIAHLEKILALLSWDQETYMPPAGAKARSEQISFLVGEWHQRVCDPWWDEVFSHRDAIPDLTDDHKRILEIFKRDRDKEVKIPLKLATALASAVSEAFQSWHEARSRSDFSIFQPALQKVFDLSLEKAAALGYTREDSYDAFLDLHEEGLTRKEFDPVANAALEVIRTVLGTIQEKGTSPRKDFLTRRYPIEKQEQLCSWVLPRIGFDTQRGRLDISPHPFSTTIALDDVRLTTRYSENDPFGSLYSVLHEAGHGLYEQGFLPQWEDTPFAQAVSLGIHESQSRFWENQIGRSREFLHWMWPEMKRIYAGILDDVKVEDIFRAVNEVRPSFIRTEADEVTYGLHIIIRYEIEKKLFAGDITLSDAPEMWDSLYTSYLGITPQNASEGILQDIHWSHGSFGYFPTYLLGNLYASQWYAVMQQSLDIPTLVERGEFQPILEWMRLNIHQHGRRYDARTLCQRISGEDLNVAYFASYLKQRYEAVYGIIIPL